MLVCELLLRFRSGKLGVEGLRWGLLITDNGVRLIFPHPSTETSRASLPAGREGAWHSELQLVTPLIVWLLPSLGLIGGALTDSGVWT